ncbi:hypothetical protein Tco_0156841 [Tanacetum coccineum]
MTPPPGFSTLTPLPGPNASELPPITTSTFSSRTLENAPLTNRASTSNNPEPMISPAFVEVSYEVLESLLMELRRQMRNQDLCTQLEYFSEEYDEEREIEPRPTRAQETTIVPQVASLRIRRQRERVVEFEDAPNREGSRIKRNTEGGRPSERRVEDNGPEAVILRLTQEEISLLTAPTGSSIPVSHRLMHPSGVFPNSYPFNAQPVYPLPNAPIYLNQAPSGLFTEYTSCVTSFVCWIEDHPLQDELKMPSHVRSYNRKGDPDNFLHLFEGTICSILNYKDLKAKLRSHFSQQNSTEYTPTHYSKHKQREGESIGAFVTRSLLEFLSTKLSTGYKGLMEKTYTWIEAIEVATNGTPNDRRENSKRFKRDSSWDNNKRKRRDRPFSYRRVNHRLLSNLSKSPREILATKKVAKTFEQPPRMIGSRRSRDMTKYCYFHEDHGHETNDYRELRHQIEEAVRSGQLSHLVKEIKKGKMRISDTQ